MWAGCGPVPLTAGAWEHAFVTSEGSAGRRFTRAVQRGQVEQAELFAKELPNPLPLAHALQLVCLCARMGSPKFEPAAVRLLGRLALEGRDMNLGDVQLAAAALAALRGRRSDRASEILGRLL